MPVRGTCLLKDTPLKEALFNIVEFTAYERLKAGKSASVGGIYSDIRQAGVEVDLPTIGEIYMQVLPREDAHFDSDIDVEDFVLKTWNDTINKLIPQGESEEVAVTGERQIGRERPEARIVEFILDRLFGDVAEDLTTTSDMKVLQGALWRGIQRKLGRLTQEKPTRKTMKELILQSLGWEDIGIENVHGQMNSISDLYSSMRNELAKAAADVRAGSSPAIIERFNEYIKGLENASYQLLFSRKDALQVRDDALKNAGFGKTLANGNIVLDWDKLAAYTGSVADLREQAHKAFEDAGFSQDVIERLKDSLEQEFYDLRAETMERQLSKSELFAKGGKKLVLEEAGLNELLGGRTMAQWVREQQIETVEQLAQRAYASLDRTKYVRTVKQKIVQRLIDFFNENYARVNNAEAQRAIDDILGEQTALEWIKANGIQNQDELYTALDRVLAGRTISAQNDAAIRAAFSSILDINNRAERELAQREKQTEYEYRPKKSDLKRLVELYHLGIFEGRHNQLLYDLLRVDGLQQQDIADLENLAAAASDLARRAVDVNGYNLSDDIFVNRRMQYIQRHIDSIVERNIANKTRLVSLIKFAANYLDLMLTGLLAGLVTMVQNILSGAKSVLTGMRFSTSAEKVVEDNGQFYIESPFGRSRAYGSRGEAEADIIDFTGKSKQSLRLYWSMLKEVALTGQSYGEEIGSFAARELFTNTLRWKWGEGLLGKGTTAKDKFKSILFALSLPSRIGLLAFDSANKVALTNKIFYNMIYHSLEKRGMDKTLIAPYMNEMLYGQSFRDARKIARKVIEENNRLLKPEFRSKVTEAEVTNLANDIIKANLNTQGSMVDTDVLEAALKGSYHVAGLGLGHEPNNPLSGMIKRLRDDMRRREQRLIDAKDWHNLSLHRLGSLLLNGFLIRFTGGATNWLWLRAKEGLALGILTGGARMLWNKEIDFADKKNLKEQMQRRERARNDFARGLIGLSYTAMAYAIGYAVTGGADDDDEERLKRLKEKKNKTDADRDKIEDLELKTSIYRQIKQDTGKDRWFRILAPDIMLIKYYTDNNKGNLALGFWNYIQRTYYGNDRFSVGQRIKDAISLYEQGDNAGAEGALTSIIGDRVGVPYWRATKEYYRVVTNIFKGDKTPPSKYEPATTWDEGLFGGGALQDLGIYDRNSRITMIPGVGVKAYEKYKELGIEKMDDLINRPYWYNMKYKGSFIMDADERRKAEKFWGNYQKTIKE